MFEEKYFVKFGFLVSRFKPELYYWEVVLLARLCLLVTCLMLLSNDEAMLTMSTIAVLFISSVLHEHNKVFK